MATPKITEDSLVLTVEQAGRMLGFHKNAAYAAVARGDIPSVKIGSRIRVPKAALERLLEPPQVSAGK